MRFLFAVLLLCLTRSVQAQSNYLDGNADAIEAFLDRNFRDTNAGMVIGLVDEHGNPTRFGCRISTIGHVPYGDPMPKVPTRFPRF